MPVIKPGLAKYRRGRIIFWDIIEKAEIIHIQIGQKASMQDQNRNRPVNGLGAVQPGVQNHDWSEYTALPFAASVADMASASNPDSPLSAAERTRLRQGVMHVRIRHFYCTLE